MLATVRRIARTRDEGASAVEYGLLVAAIAALVVIIVFSLGGLVKEVFKDTCDGIKTNTQGPSGISSTCAE
jgi:pilus assembly protein Flp/PilA